MRHRNRLAAFAVAFVALAVAAPFAIAGPGPSNGPPQDRVYGGGTIPVGSCTDGSTPFCTGVTREFSMLAVSDPRGQGAYGTITFGNPEVAHGVNLVVRVKCLAVRGNVAEVGGVIVQALDPTAVGGQMELFIRDSGQPGAVARDGVSPIFLPPTFDEANCRNVSSDAFGAGYFTLTYGDVAVEDR